MNASFRARVVAALIFAAAAPAAFAQGGPGGGGPGPGPAPNPWIVSGGTVNPNGLKVITAASNTSRAGFNLPQGTAPSSPVNGDLWTTTSGLFARINGSTVGPFAGASISGLTGDVTATGPGVVPATLATAQPGAHTWAATQTFTVAPVFTDQSGSRAALGLGTAAVQNTGTSGANVPLLNGANTWSAAQVINLNSGSLPSAISGTVLLVGAANSTTGRIQISSFGAISAFTGAVYGGTAASPTQVTSGTQLTGINAYAYTGSALVGPIASFRTYAAENIGAAAWGTKACIATTPSTTAVLTDGLCQQNSGGLTVGSPTGGDKGVGTLNTAGSIYINGTAISLTAAGLTVGTSTITSGTTTRILFNNVGVLGEYTISGSGTVVAMATSPSFTTPAIGVATGTSLALGGCTIGSNSACGAGSVTWGGTITSGANGGTGGQITLNGSTSGSQAIKVAAAAGSLSALQLPTTNGNNGEVLSTNGSGVLSWVAVGGTGTVTSVSFTGGLISVATATTTPALTVAGTSGGVPYFSSSSTWASSAALAANAIVLGGGAGTAPATTTTGTGVVTALGVNTGSAGAFSVIIAKGSKTLNTTAVSSATCGTVQTDTATGAATTDTVLASFNGDPSAITGYVPSTSGMLTIIPYPTTNTMNFKVCNNTGSSITPGAVTINWIIVR